MVISRRELVKVAGAAMAVGAGVGCVPMAHADEPDGDMLAARFQKIFGRYQINDVISADDAAFVEQYALPADGGQAQGTYELDEHDMYEGCPCSIAGNWYYGDYLEDNRWHFYGATLQAEYPEGTAEEIVVGMRFMAFQPEASSYKLIWKDEQCDSEKDLSLRSTEFVGDFMGDLAYIAVSCYATFKSQSHLLTPFMAGAPFMLVDEGAYATGEIPVERRLHVFSSDGADTLLQSGK